MATDEIEDRFTVYTSLPFKKTEDMYGKTSEAVGISSDWLIGTSVSVDFVESTDGPVYKAIADWTNYIRKFQIESEISGNWLLFKYTKWAGRDWRRLKRERRKYFRKELAKHGY